jgi:hypothetical protein
MRCAQQEQGGTRLTSVWFYLKALQAWMLPKIMLFCARSRSSSSSKLSAVNYQDQANHITMMAFAASNKMHPSETCVWSEPGGSAGTVCSCVGNRATRTRRVNNATFGGMRERFDAHWRLMMMKLSTQNKQ